MNLQYSWWNRYCFSWNFLPTNLKLHAKVRIVKNSKKIFKLQIREWEQVSKNDRGFNKGKTKKDLQYFQQVCEGALFISKMSILDPHLIPQFLLQNNAWQSSWRITCQYLQKATIKLDIQRFPRFQKSPIAKTITIF